MKTMSRAGAATTSSSCHGPAHDSSTWIGGRRGVIIAGVATIAIGALAVSQNRITLSNLASLLIWFPCAAMMIKCMKGHRGSGRGD